jgi:hypothetical protein
MRLSKQSGIICTQCRSTPFRYPPNIQLETLVTMAVTRQPPFEEKGEKGFRDSLILFTILDHMKTAQYPCAVLLSGDKIFRHDAVLKRFRDEGRELLVATDMTAASQLIVEQVKASYGEYLEGEKKKLKALLLPKADQLFDFVLREASIDNLRAYYRSHGSFSGWELRGS